MSFWIGRMTRRQSVRWRWSVPMRVTHHTPIDYYRKEEGYLDCNQSFEEKVKVYKDSTYKITNSLEKYGNKFGFDEIKARQLELAQHAVKTWPLTFS